MPPLGANLYKKIIHLAIQGILGPQWAVGTIIWATSGSIHYWMFCVHNESQWPTGATICIIHEWHIGWAVVYLLDPHWPLRATIHQHHVDLAILWVLSAQWAVGALYEPEVNRCRCRHSESPVSHRSHYMNDLSIIPVILGPQWATGATIHHIM